MSNYRTLRRLIREFVLAEVDIEDVKGIEGTEGSTHGMNKCQVNGENCYLKFSNLRWDEWDPSLQILIEYLAYKLYKLYQGVTMPTPELVYDKKEGRVGLATTPAAGKASGFMRYNPESRIKLARALALGVYVDVFLANWDVIGTGSGGNAFYDPETGVATRIDPGGSLTFRAQGGRRKMSSRVGELETMMKGMEGAASVFSALEPADLKEAAENFLSVPWEKISSAIDQTYEEVNTQLVDKGMPERLVSQWKSDIDEIKDSLSKRYKVVEKSCLIAAGRALKLRV